MDRPRVLIVEDEAIVALALQMKLTSWGYDTAAVEHTGEGAITAFDREDPDIALLDIFLADSVDGIEVARHIKERKSTPFVFLTASQDARTQERALAESPAAIVEKPYDEEILRAALKSAIGTPRPAA